MSTRRSSRRGGGSSGGHIIPFPSALAREPRPADPVPSDKLIVFPLDAARTTAPPAPPRSTPANNRIITLPLSESRNVTPMPTSPDSPLAP